MSKNKIVIIGGVAGGATTAARLRRLSEEDEIILFEKGEYISFANCGLPYYIGDVIKDRDHLLLQTVEGMREKLNVDVRNFSEVVAINREEKTVTVVHHPSQKTYTETYDKLIISTGAKAIVPPIPGLDEADNVFTLRNIPDMDHIKKYIESNNVQKAAVVGAGFIGLEMMENLVDLGLEVSVVEMAPQVMPPIDFEMAQIVHQQIGLHGVTLLLGDGVQKFENNGRKIVLNSGDEVEADMVLLSIGVLPESNLAKEAGLSLGVKGAVQVNEQLQTEDPDIYAIGDVIEVRDFITGQPTVIPLAWPANRQGRILADSLHGTEINYSGTMGTSIAKVFELTVATTGSNERTLKANNVAYEVVHVHPNSHAGYYPGATPLAIKLLFAPDGKVLGAQIVGIEGVDKRIDVIATAIKLGATVYDLSNLELAYAPPYSSAKDPVNIAGYAAENILKNKVETIQWSQVNDLVKEGAFFLDVREECELATGTIENSKIIPLPTLRGRLDQLPKDQTIHVFCQVGHRGYNATRILMNHGYKVKNLDGGYKTYKQGMFELNTCRIEPETTKCQSREEIAEIPLTSIANEPPVSIKVDACGLQCPGPILKVKEHIDKMNDGDLLEIEASDFGFTADIAAWCKNTNNTLVENRLSGKKVHAKIIKGTGQQDGSGDKTSSISENEQGVMIREESNAATMVVFSGDMDKALASMIIASGAAALGKEVTIFFTFWGLSILKKPNIHAKKKGMASMFDKMLPHNADKLPLSKMNMGGMGSKMMKKVMKEKNVDSLPVMIEKAHELGVKFVACTMSMDIMGISKEELMDFVEYGGVAAYLGDAEQANLNLFI